MSSARSSQEKIIDRPEESRPDGPPESPVRPAAAGEQETGGRNSHRRWRAKGAIVGCLIVGASALAFVVADRNDDPGPVSVISGSDRFFSFTLQDWVSFAEAVVVVEVTAEQRVPPTAEEERRGEGYLTRVVTLVVQETPWVRPDGQRPPDGFEVATSGWVLRAGIEVPARFSASPRLEVGQVFLMPVLELDGEEWSPLSHRSIMGVNASGELASGDEENVTDAVDALRDRTVDGVGELLTSTPPHPELATVDPSTGPIERMTAVYGEFN